MSDDSRYALRRVFDEASDLFARKNADYKDAWKHRGWMGNLGRIGEKAQRLHSTLWHEGPIGFSIAEETARETALDMINTLAFFIMNWDAARRWGSEVAESPSSTALPTNDSGAAMVMLTADQYRESLTTGAEPHAPLRTASEQE